MPTAAEALQIAWKQHQAGQVRRAEEIYRQVIEVTPRDANAWCFLGMACHDQSRYEEAVEAYVKALEIQPDFPIALSNRGNTLKQLGRLDEAEASCREAIRIKPDYPTAYNNLGVSLVAQGRLQEAADVFEQALSLMPDDPVTHSNLSAALVRQGKFDEAEHNSQEALRINPHYAEAHKNQGIVWLLLGDFERGWPEYEWRWKCPGNQPRRFSQPLWDGSSLEGRTILLHPEQGLGDTIQFVRYADVLKRQGACVVVAAQKPLMKLLAGCDGVDELIVQDVDPPSFDVHAPMLSVPGILQTNLETIPANVPYLHADEALVEQWRERLAQYDGFKIGIAWQGSPDFHADAQRSIPLKHFAALARVPGVRLFSLQKGYGSEQLAELNGEFEVIEFGEELDADSGPFMDTAAIMRNMDMMITSDTSVPHLAGALGVPTWVALSISPDWRWLLEREDNPWYPTMRLFRQETLHDWAAVFERIGNELATHVGTEASNHGVAGVERSEPPERDDSGYAGQEEPGGSLRSTPATHPSATQPPATQPSATQPEATLPESSQPEPSSDQLLKTGFNALNRSRHGYMLFNTNDMYIGKSLGEYGEFSEGEVEMFRRIVSPGDIVVEAGANIGSHTVPLAGLVGPAGTVYAFEPQRHVFQTLCANVAVNSLSNVHCFHRAVGDAPGSIVVPPLSPDSETNFGGLGLGQYSQGEEVEVVTIDSLALPGCRLLKVDVEGMEQKVLMGGQATIEQYRPALYVENDRVESSAALIEHIQSLGYRLFWHLPRMFREDNYFGNPENQFGNIVSVNMLCLADGEPPIELPEVTGPTSRWQDSM